MSGVVGIDIGGSTCKLATIKGGLVTIVSNEVSARTTPSLVAFDRNERLLGEPALSLIKSNFSNTCRNMKMLLGRDITKRSESPSLEAEIRYSLAELVQLADGSAAYEVMFKGEKTVYGATQIMGMLLTKLARTVEAFLGYSVKDVVITVPGWYTNNSRRAMADAAAIAGLSCLRICSDYISVAVDYGMYRNSSFDQEKSITVAFVSMGYSTTSVSLVQFKRSFAKVLAEISNPSLGGRDMDSFLVNLIAEKFKAKTGCDPRTTKKSLTKCQVEATRAKIILSANPDAIISIEYLMNDEDVSLPINRDDFEELCRPLQDELRKMIDSVLQTSMIAKEDIDSVEIVGGSTRVPWVQRVTREEFGLEEGSEKDVRKTLNMEETFTKGCALQGAMLSKAFKVSDFTVVDRLNNGIVLYFDGPGGQTETIPSTEDELKHKHMDVVFPRGSEIGIKGKDVWLTFWRNRDFSLKAAYQHPEQLMGDVSPTLGEWHVQVPQASDKSLRKVKVKMSINSHGVLQIREAHIVEETEVDVVVKERVPCTETAAAVDGMMDGEKDDTEKSGDKNFEEVEVTRKEKRLHRTPLTVDEVQMSCTLQLPELEKLWKAEEAANRADEELREAKKAQNDLESYIYDLRARLSDELAEYGTEEEKSAIAKALNEGEEWLWDHRDESKLIYEERKAILTNISNPVVYRLKELRNRDAAVDDLLRVIRSYKAASTDKAYAHISNEQILPITNKLADVEKWLQQKISEQEACRKHDNPILTTTGLRNQGAELKELADRILSEPPPKVQTPEHAEPTVEEPMGEPDVAEPSDGDAKMDGGL